MTVMFTHKDLSAWDALITALIEAGFNITRVWPIKTETESSLNIRDKRGCPLNDAHRLSPAHARRLADCSAAPVARGGRLKSTSAVRDGHSLRSLAYNFKPVDIYNAAYGPALRVISENWGARRITPHPGQDT